MLVKCLRRHIKNIGKYVYKWLEGIGRYPLLVLFILSFVLGYYLFLIMSLCLGEKSSDRIKRFKKLLEEFENWIADWIDLEELLMVYLFIYIILIIGLIIGSL